MLRHALLYAAAYYIRQIFFFFACLGMPIRMPRQTLLHTLHAAAQGHACYGILLLAILVFLHMPRHTLQYAAAYSLWLFSLIFFMLRHWAPHAVTCFALTCFCTFWVRFYLFWSRYLIYYLQNKTKHKRVQNNNKTNKITKYKRLKISIF